MRRFALLLVAGCLDVPSVNVAQDAAVAATPDAAEDTASPGPSADLGATDVPAEGDAAHEADLPDLPEAPGDALLGDALLGDAAQDEVTADLDTAEDTTPDAPDTTDAPPGCTVASLTTSTGCAPVGDGGPSEGFDAWDARVVDWNGDGCDDVVIPRAGKDALVVLFGDTTRGLSCALEVPLTAAGQGVAPYQVVPGSLCGGPAPDAYIIGRLNGTPWVGLLTDGPTGGALVGGPIPTEAYFEPGGNPAYGRVAAMDNAGPDDLLFGSLHTGLFSVLGDCTAAMGLIAGRFSIDDPTEGDLGEVRLVHVLESPRRVFTAGSLVASLHDVDAAGNLINVSYAPVDTADGYDGYALTPYPPAGGLELVSGLFQDVSYGRYTVDDGLYRAEELHAQPTASVGTPEHAFVRDATPGDGLFGLLLVDGHGNDLTAGDLAVHWFPTVGALGGTLGLGTQVTLRYDKESPRPGYRAQTALWADADGDGSQELLLVGASGAVECLEVGAGLTRCTP